MANSLTDAGILRRLPEVAQGVRQLPVGGERPAEVAIITALSDFRSHQSFQILLTQRDVIISLSATDPQLSQISRPEGLNGA